MFIWSADASEVLRRIDCDLTATNCTTQRLASAGLVHRLRQSQADVRHGSPLHFRNSLPMILKTIGTKTSRYSPRDR